MTNANRLVTIFGGSGFLGRHVAHELARRGWRIRIATRRPDLSFPTQPSGRVGQIMPVQANLRFPESIAPAIDRADAVINLVGILRPRGPQTFETIHERGARALAEAAKAAGIENFVHVSALGADLESPSLYARTKAAGEAAVLETLPSAIVLRPSVVFGPEDQFFNRFAAMARLIPALPLIGGGKTKLQPVYVGDVAEAAGIALDGKAQSGKIYELGGPEIASLKDIMRFVVKVTERKRLLLPLPFPLAWTMAAATEAAMAVSFGFFPDLFEVTRDQVELLRRDNIVSDAAMTDGRTLMGLGIAPESFQALEPAALVRFRKTGRFSEQLA
ncbi:MAG TPA: complex I NDUFA9 subunit family protein [Methylovirgula sp.]